MVSPDLFGTLAEVPLFAGLAEGDLKVLMLRMRMQHYAEGQVVFDKDAPGDTFHLILGGLVKIYLASEQGQEAVLMMLRPGEFFGELSLLDGAPRSASAMAMEATVTCTLTRADFLGFIRERPQASVPFLEVLASRLRRADGIIADAAFLDLQARLAKMLLELAERFGRKRPVGVEIDLRLRQQDVADMVSAARESVNRTLAGFVEEGILRIERQRITILDIELLRRRIP
jgi:CRP-like cAMP-binding protein